jgi:hypothetical protein
VNFVAHINVARALEPADPEFALGAAVPDLAAMSGLPIDPDRLSPGLRRGVALHHRTDRAFHANPLFRAGAADLRHRLSAQGLPTGPVRAVGHAGWELLLDGCLLERPGTADGLVEVLTLGPALNTAASDRTEARRWTALVESLVTERWWMGYRSPLFVAQRLYGRLRARPRLAFEADRVADVARALEGSRADVDSVTDEVVSSTVSALAPAGAAISD